MVVILMGQDDGLVHVEPMLSTVGDWTAHLALDLDEQELSVLRRHERTGRPLGGSGFIERLETQLARFLRKRKPGPKGPRKTN